MRLMRPTPDPRTTPFIEDLADVRRIYLTLPEPLDVAYAIGALAGLRTGEVFALRWENVDLARRRIHVRESVKGPLKDKESRVVPILDRLLPVLGDWKKRTGGSGRIIQPLRRDGLKIDKHTPGVYLAEALEKLELDRPGLRWYQATRHTFASQWVLAGGSIEKLKEILGHYSVVMTERYAHLRPDLFSARDLATIDLDLNAGEPDQDPSGPENGHETARPQQLPGRIQLKLRRKCRSRPVSRVRNTVGTGRFRGRPVATRGRKHSRRRDWRRQVVSLARHRKADYVRCACPTVKCDMGRRSVHLGEEEWGPCGLQLRCAKSAPPDSPETWRMRSSAAPRSARSAHS
jgi:hypothetical protein